MHACERYVPVRDACPEEIYACEMHACERFMSTREACLQVNLRLNVHLLSREAFRVLNFGFWDKVLMAPTNTATSFRSYLPCKLPGMLRGWQLRQADCIHRPAFAH